MPKPEIHFSPVFGMGFYISEDGTLMLRECVENAAESEFKCEMKEGEQGRVSFLLDGVQNLVLIHAVLWFPRPLSTIDY